MQNSAIALLTEWIVYFTFAPKSEQKGDNGTMRSSNKKEVAKM